MGRAAFGVRADLVDAEEKSAVALAQNALRTTDGGESAA